jgi:hypothetical protein
MAKKNEVATREGQELEQQQKPAMFDEVLEDMGRGVSTDAADNLVPLIYVLQPLSPQVLDGPAHIEGARGGDIWLKNFPENPVVSGKEGIWFQPCSMYQKWTEWIPRDHGGGFVGSYDHNDGKLPEGAVRDSNQKQRPRYYFPDTGNECVDTRYEAGLYWRDGTPYPYVIPFKSTGHSISRGWMTKRSGLIIRAGKRTGVWPAYSHVYKLTTTQRTNSHGTWYLFQIGAPEFLLTGWAGKPVSKIALEAVGGDGDGAYAAGRALSAAFESGAKVEAPEDTGDAEEASYTDEGQFNTPSNGKPLDDNIPY